jgi:hypothetical protein
VDLNLSSAPIGSGTGSNFWIFAANVFSITAPDQAHIPDATNSLRPNNLSQEHLAKRLAGRMLTNIKQPEKEKVRKYRNDLIESSGIVQK